MATQFEPAPLEPISQQTIPTRDRLLAAFDSAPRLSDGDAERINTAVREAREASIADGLPD